MMFALATCLAVSAIAPVYAVNVFPACSVDPGSEVCKAAGTDRADSTIKTVINTVIYIIGIAAVIMIVIGGLRYVLSGGDSSGTKGAKDTILYAVIGLVIAILSFSIVNFVVGRF